MMDITITQQRVLLKCLGRKLLITFLWFQRHIHKSPTRSERRLDSRIDTARVLVLVASSLTFLCFPHLVGGIVIGVVVRVPEVSPLPLGQQSSVLLKIVLFQRTTSPLGSSRDLSRHLISMVHTVGSKCTSNPQASPSQEASPNSEPQRLLRKP